MHTENGILVDLDQVRRVVDNADVFTVAFRLFGERLLIDTRFDLSDPDGPCRMPMVAIVDAPRIGLATNPATCANIPVA